MRMVIMPKLWEYTQESCKIFSYLLEKIMYKILLSLSFDKVFVTFKLVH